jgi:hypothetical protein
VEARGREASAVAARIALQLARGSGILQRLNCRKEELNSKLEVYAVHSAQLGRMRCTIRSQADALPWHSIK